MADGKRFKGWAAWKSEYWILVALAVFFGGLLLVLGVQEYPDSETYIRMYLGREPVYPLLLLLLRTVFGEGYKLAAGIVQNLLAVWSLYLLIVYFRRLFGMGALGTGAVALIFLTPHVLTPLGSASRMVYTNSILSEGISYSIFNLMAYSMLRMVLEDRKRKKDLVIALFYALLLSLTRGQMMPMLLAWGCAGLYTVAVSEKGKKRAAWLLLVVLMTGASFGIRSGLMFAYNYGVKGAPAANLGGGITFLTNVIYSAEAEDGDGIADEGIRNTFYSMQEAAEKDGLTYRTAEGGLLGQAAHLEECHDRLKFNQVELFITWYLNNTYGLDGRAREIATDEIAMEIVKDVLPNSFPRWFVIYVPLAVSGFIRTVAVLHPLLNWYALAVYVAAVLLMLRLLRKDRKSKAALCMLLVFLLICANVFATSMTIMCLSRYMIYNMSLFYAAGAAMLWEWLRRIKESRL